jgi:hypothetical protein
MTATLLPGPVWRCYRCKRRFVHARFLATHLIEIHGEGAAR